MTSGGKQQALIRVDEAEFAEAQELARTTYEQFKQWKGHYSNTLNSHLRGRLGELSCAKWLLGHGIFIRELFRDQQSVGESDILAGAGEPSRLDVKTWDRRFWGDMGRCVAVGQLPKLKRKADIVVWCETESRLSAGMSVWINGWNSIADIESAPVRLTGPAMGRKVENHQVALESVRAPGALVKLLVNGNRESVEE